MLETEEQIPNDLELSLIRVSIGHAVLNVEFLENYANFSNSH